ncbi:MAG: MCE family protein [Solirubrobacterales bacterium]|nr:MCE family protein [Solirubrobacterales bacterium]MBV9363802.1 MCE family protein [Solirubrobacterales bacterium]
MRRHRARVSNLTAGLIAAVVVAVAVYLAFGGATPFAGSPFVLKALFTSQTELHIPSPVRIAGVDVGQVTSVQRVGGSSDAAVVTMHIDGNGLPIHANATAAVQSRIFLEGNFYVDLRPGSPNAPLLASGATLPAANTSGPVQLDRVLAALTSNARANLQTLVQGFGAGLNSAPTPGQDATQDPSVRGLTGGQALNESLRYSADAFKASAIVNQALLGVEPHDLSRSVVGNEQVFRALASRQAELQGFVTTFDATMRALAARQQDLSNTIAALPPLLRTADRALTSLDASFGPTRQFAKTILAGVEQLGPTIDAALPWLAQATALVSRRELGGLVADLAPAVEQTASTIRATTALVSASDQLARCVTHNLVPTGNQVIQDPPVSSGMPIYQELLSSAVGIAGAAQNFDGNGRYLRSTPAGGSTLVQTSNLGSQGPLFGNAVLPPLGTRPAWPGQAPAVNSSTPCFQNTPPDVNRVATGAGP